MALEDTQTNTYIHILMQYARSSLAADNAWLRVAERLTLDGIRFAPWVRHPIVLPDEHPLFAHLHHVIPTKNYICTFLESCQVDSSTLTGVLKTVLDVSGFLMRDVRHEPIVKAYDLLEVFDVSIRPLGPADLCMAIFCALPARMDLLRTYRSGSIVNSQDHLDYVRSHLAQVCSWAMDDTQVCVCLDEFARVISGLMDIEEYQLVWEEAIDALPTIMHREEHRPLVSSFSEKLVSYHNSVPGIGKSDSTSLPANRHMGASPAGSRGVLPVATQS